MKGRMKPIMANDKNWEVLLNNVGAQIASGRIPLSAFHYDPKDKGTLAAPNTADINGIAVQIAIPDQADSQTVTLSIKDLTLYGASTAARMAAALRTAANAISLKECTTNRLKLAVSASGTYDVTILSANGRAVAAARNQRLVAGNNSVAFKSLPRGVYVVTVDGRDIKKTMKAVVK